MSKPNRLESLQTLKFANLDGAFSTAFATMVTGAFLVGFIKLLGGGDVWINMVTAVPTALGLLQIPGAMIAKAYPSYKWYVAWGGGIWRLMYVPVALLPLLALNNDVRLVLLFSCVSIAALCVYLVNSTYNEWLSQLVPPNSRGWFFSRRNAINVATGAIAGIVGGFILDAFRRSQNEERGYAVIFWLGVVFAALSYYFFLRMKDLQREKVEKQSLRSGLAGLVVPFRDRDFRRVLIFLGVFFVGQMFAGNLYAAFALETLKLPFAVIQGSVVTQAIGTVLAARMWGFLADKYGNKPCLMLAGFGIATNPIAWLLCQPGATTFNSVLLLFSHVLMGIFWSGVNLTQFNLLLATAKGEDRGAYIGSGLAVQGLVGGLAPLLGALLMTSLRMPLGTESAYKTVFFTALLLRFLSVFFLIPVREEGSSMVGRTLRDLTRVTPRGMRAMRMLNKSGDVASRAEAIRQVGSEGIALASDELIRSLSDPSPRVRRQAAAALGRLGGPEAAQALVQHAMQHPDLVDEETIEAIGESGSDVAAPLLIKMLQSPRSLLRRAAAKALGRIGSHDAVQALMQAASEVGDPDLRRSSIQALRVLEATEAEAVIADSLFDPHPSVRIAAAEAVSELELRGALPYVRQSLAYYSDEARGEVAYALGAVGTEEDLVSILETAEHVGSVSARRRCLLGAARLLGVELPLYRLLLVEEFARDQALLELLQPLLRGNRKFQAALATYSSGDEKAAIELLYKLTKNPTLPILAQHAVEESFLVAAVLVSR